MVVAIARRRESASRRSVEVSSAVKVRRDCGPVVAPQSDSRPERIGIWCPPVLEACCWKPVGHPFRRVDARREAMAELSLGVDDA